jgi:hypothetical protein
MANGRVKLEGLARLRAYGFGEGLQRANCRLARREQPPQQAQDLGCLQWCFPCKQALPNEQFTPKSSASHRCATRHEANAERDAPATRECSKKLGEANMRAAFFEEAFNRANVVLRELGAAEEPAPPELTSHEWCIKCDKAKSDLDFTRRSSERTRCRTCHHKPNGPVRRIMATGKGFAKRYEAKHPDEPPCHDEWDSHDAVVKFVWDPLVQREGLENAKRSGKYMLVRIDETRPPVPENSRLKPMKKAEREVALVVLANKKRRVVTPVEELEEVD